MTAAEAEECLDGSILHLQELTAANDYRNSDLRDECSGLLGVNYDPDFYRYATSMTDWDNIPQDVKDRYVTEDEDETKDLNEFNPMAWVGELGDDVCEEFFTLMI